LAWVEEGGNGDGAGLYCCLRRRALLLLTDARAGERTVEPRRTSARSGIRPHYCEIRPHYDHVLLSLRTITIIVVVVVGSIVACIFRLGERTYTESAGTRAASSPVTGLSRNRTTLLYITEYYIKSRTTVEFSTALNLFSPLI
jgi:hypothetical protein